MTKNRLTKPLEWYDENAPQLAQEVVNAWGVNWAAGNSQYFSEDFKQLLEQTFRYWDARRIAANQREYEHLTATAEAAEKKARREFAAAYKEHWEKHEKARSA